MKEPIWVLQNTVTAVHQMLLAEHGGLSGIRDETLLESALARPQQLFAYTENISITWLAAVFLELNGYALDALESEAVVIFEELAAGNLDETSLANWFRDSSALKV